MIRWTPTQDINHTDFVCPVWCFVTPIYLLGQENEFDEYSSKHDQELDDIRSAHKTEVSTRVQCFFWGVELGFVNQLKMVTNYVHHAFKIGINRDF